MKFLNLNIEDINLTGGSIISIFLDSLFTGCLLNLFTKEVETYELPDVVSRRTLQTIPSTLIKTTGYVTDALFSFGDNNKPLYLSQIDVWCFLLQFLQVCSLLHSCALYFSPVQLKQSFFSLRIFHRLFVSVTA